MHSTEAGGNAVPAFLTKLWKLVEDSKCDDLICWGMNGTSFIIRNQARFAKELLPLYFKHNNMASFIRQLNMYGFRKVVNIEQGGLRPEKDEMEFQHLYFLKGHQYFLDLIKRKVPTGKVPDEGKGKTDIVNSMLADMKQLKGKQETMDSKLSNMKRENEALWREVANLRQKHVKQQQIVNKLIQFLLSLVQPNRSIGLKRKLPLMINDGSRDTKASRLGCLPFENEAISDASIASPDTDEIIKGSGPVIHDVTDTLDDESILTNDAPLIPPAPEMEEDVPVITDPVIINTDPIVINDPVFDLEGTGTLIHIPEQDPNSIVMLDPETIVIEAPTDLEKIITLPNEPMETLNSTDEEIKTEIEAKELPEPSEATPPLLPKAEVPGCSNTSVTDESVAGTDIFREAIRSLNEIKDETMKKREEHSEIVSSPSVTTSLTNIPIDDLSLENLIDNSSKNEESPETGKISAPTITDAMVPISDYKFKHECRKDMSDDVDTIQHELDTLKELLSGNGYTIDVSTLLGLFNPDDPLPSTSLSSQDILGDKNEINGTELIQYNPSLMELADDDSEFFDPTNSKSAADGYETILFDNVESILPECVINEESLATPDPLLSMPSLESSKKKIRSKKSP